jgi:hypothetical protein
MRRAAGGRRRMAILLHHQVHLNVSIKPERLDQLAEALEAIIRATAQTNKSEIVCDAILAYAASVPTKNAKR